MTILGNIFFFGDFSFWSPKSWRHPSCRHNYRNTFVTKCIGENYVAKNKIQRISRHNISHILTSEDKTRTKVECFNTLSRAKPFSVFYFWQRNCRQIFWQQMCFFKYGNNGVVANFCESHCSKCDIITVTKYIGWRQT